MTLAAYRATVAAGSADISTSVSEHTGNGFQLVMTDQGVFSWTSDLGQMTADIKTGRTDIQSSEIVDGHDEYQKISADGEPIGGTIDPAAAEWSKTTWTGGERVGLLSGLAFGTPGPPSPEALLQLLESQATDPSDIGPATVDGVATTHYRSQLPVSNLTAGDAAETAAAERSLGSSSVAVDFWVDPAHLLRRMSLAVTLRTIPTQPGTKQSEDPGVKPPLTVTITLDLSNYGVPVDVTPPPADQVSSGGNCQADAGGISCEESSPGTVVGGPGSSGG